MALRGTGCTDSSPGFWLRSSLQAQHVSTAAELLLSKEAGVAVPAARSSCPVREVRGNGPAKRHQHHQTGRFASISIRENVEPLKNSHESIYSQPFNSEAPALRV